MTSDEMIDALRRVPAGTSADVSVSMATFADSDEGAELSTFSGKVRDLQHGHGPVDGTYSL